MRPDASTVSSVMRPCSALEGPAVIRYVPGSTCQAPASTSQCASAARRQRDVDGRPPRPARPRRPRSRRASAAGARPRCPAATRRPARPRGPRRAPVLRTAHRATPRRPSHASVEVLPVGVAEAVAERVQRRRAVAVVGAVADEQALVVGERRRRPGCVDGRPVLARRPGGRQPPAGLGVAEQDVGQRVAELLAGEPGRAGRPATSSAHGSSTGAPALTTTTVRGLAAATRRDELVLAAGQRERRRGRSPRSRPPRWCRPRRPRRRRSRGQRDRARRAPRRRCRAAARR